MKIVVGLGGNALLTPGQALTADVLRQNVRVAASSVAPLADRHTLVVSHGNGPQIGLLALQAEAYAPGGPYPLDVLGAESEGMLGYVIEQELRTLLPRDRVATLLTLVEVDPGDAAFATPTKPIGPVYEEAEAERLRREGRWTLARASGGWRRVVASPRPRRVLEMEAITCLLENGFTVICAGGGGIPTVCHCDGEIEGVEAVIDKDYASALLASQLEADLLVLATDVDAVYAGWNQPDARPLRHATPEQMDALKFEPGSMAPKIDAATSFVRDHPTRRAAIGALVDVEAMVDGVAGTQITATLTERVGNVQGDVRPTSGGPR